jgi:predicted esterase
MWVFMRNFPEDFLIVAPRGIHPGPTGYSWRPPRAAPAGESGEDTPRGRPGLKDLEPAARALPGLVDDYAAAAGIPADRFDVIGFSQGAALAAVLALLHPARIGRAGMLAGFLAEGAQALLEGRPLEGKLFFVAHGTRDQTVPVETARQSVESLEGAGARVTYCEDAVGHKLGLACLRALEKFFA